MKIVSLLLLIFLNIGFSQTLVFLGKQDMITFQENDLIKLNGKKYRYQKAIKDKTQLQLLEPGLFGKATIILDTSKIETFRKYERFRISNSLKTGFMGLVTGVSTGSLYGFLGASHGGWGNSPSEDIAIGALFGMILGTYAGVLTGTGGLIYGFISLGEGNLNYINKYTLKFDYRY